MRLLSKRKDQKSITFESAAFALAKDKGTADLKEVSGWRSRNHVHHPLETVDLSPLASMIS